MYVWVIVSNRNASDKESIIIIPLVTVSVMFLLTYFDSFSAATGIDKAETESPRRRRHQQQQTMMMLMGMVVMIFVPMGFQFLAALGGKAFLMAKLALLLASVNGLKRVKERKQI